MPILNIVFQDLAKRVDDSMMDAARSDDEGVVTEDFSESRGSSETKDTIDERKCPFGIQRPPAMHHKSLKLLLRYWHCAFKSDLLVFSVLGRY